MNDETRLALLEQSINHIELMLQSMERKIQNIDNQFDRIDEKFSRLETKIDSKFTWTIGVMITLFSGLYATALGGMIARLCRWI